MTHLVNFQPRFADAVASGTKRQTLRRPRKRPIRVGDSLHLYTGLRAKGARMLRAVTVVSITRLELREDGVRGPIESLARFAFNDGFYSWPEMKDWFRDQYGLPVELDVIQW